MHLAGGKCFVEATKENTEQLARYSDILVMSVFFKKRGTFAEDGRLLALTDRYIVYYKVPFLRHLRTTPRPGSSVSAK